jgi:hypothetical protein
MVCCGISNVPKLTVSARCAALRALVLPLTKSLSRHQSFLHHCLHLKRFKRLNDDI